ncbi:MAG: hypothetical protein V4625_20820 [Pseudomonadota bacterium]
MQEFILAEEAKTHDCGKVVFDNHIDRVRILQQRAVGRVVHARTVSVTGH